MVVQQNDHIQETDLGVAVFFKASCRMFASLDKFLFMSEVAGSV